MPRDPRERAVEEAEGSKMKRCRSCKGLGRGKHSPQCPACRGLGWK